MAATDRGSTLYYTGPNTPPYAGLNVSGHAPAAPTRRPRGATEGGAAAAAAALGGRGGVLSVEIWKQEPIPHPRQQRRGHLVGMGAQS